MDETDERAALHALREAIREAGGSVAVARECELQRTHLSAIAWGRRPMGRAAATRLKRAVALPDAVWVELLTCERAEQ